MCGHHHELTMCGHHHELTMCGHHHELSTKAHASRHDGSLAIAIKPKSKEIFRTVALMIF
jgi:hypothetical protein